MRGSSQVKPAHDVGMSFALRRGHGESKAQSFRLRGHSQRSLGRLRA